MKILRINQVLDLTGLSRATLWRREREGTFPQRVQLGANSVGWKSDEVLQWLENLPRGSTAA
jgi:prophage regulatory protein